MSKALREIQAFPKTARVIAEEALAEVEKLRELNPELVAALEHILAGSLSLPRFAEQEARVAIAKAKEQA